MQMSKRGAVVPLVVLTTAGILLILGFVTVFGYRSMVRQEMQAAADAAAHAGAALLCWDENCYTDAELAVVRVLQGQTVHGSLGAGARSFMEGGAALAGPGIPRWGI